MTAWAPGLISVASAVSATVLNALWQDALLVVCVWLLLRAWPRINAVTRYVVWSATLTAAFIVPVVTTGAFFTPARTISSAATQPAWSGTAPVHVPSHGAVAPTAAVTKALRLSPERLRITLSAPLAITIFTIWLLLAVYALVRLTIGLLRLEHLKRDALPLPVEYRDAMPQWLRANKGARDVRLCVSDETDVPVAVGLFDAMILIPRSLLEHLSEPEVDQICLHELAHLRRADDWTNGAQRIISALLGWNPAAQFVGQQLDLEREVACDDWVLSYVRQVRPYALCLTKMAENAAWPRRTIPAPGVFATRKHISLRVERLLGVGRNIATNLAPGPAAAAVAVVAALTLVIAVVAPSVAAAPIVAAEESVPPVAAAPAHHAMQAKRVATTVAPSSSATPLPPRKTHVQVPAVHLEVPATKVTVPANKIQVPAVHVEVPAVRVEVPAVHVEVPATKVGIPKTSVTVSEAQLEAQKAAQFDAKRLAQGITKSIASGVIRGLHGTSIAQGNSCVGCNYSGVNWSGRDVRGANYNGVDFSDANLSGVNFSGGSFSGTDFSGANLAGASFRNAHLTGCDFSNANLSGVDFTGARMSGCQFTHARLGSSQLRDVLNGCKGCDFSHAELSGLDLRGVHTHGDDFSGADLRNVNFAGAELVGADFSGAKLDGASFAGATLNGCDLSGVDLRRVDLSRAKLIGTDLENR
jgi:uncharacterized protein YjbI with pentapeptide repeats/beta-lactamase regulating signal transducer with metallopeptidase domain